MPPYINSVNLYSRYIDKSTQSRFYKQLKLGELQVANILSRSYRTLALKGLNTCLKIKIPF